MYPNSDYIEASKKQEETFRYILEHGEVTFHNEYGGDIHKVIVKFIYCKGEFYYVVENYVGSLVELRKLSDIT